MSLVESCEACEERFGNADDAIQEISPRLDFSQKFGQPSDELLRREKEPEERSCTTACFVLGRYTSMSL